MNIKVIMTWSDEIAPGTLQYVMGLDGSLWVAKSVAGNLETSPEWIRQDGWEWGLIGNPESWNESRINI